MNVQIRKLILAVIHNFRNLTKCSIRYPVSVFIDLTGQYHANRSCHRHFVGIIQTVIVRIVPNGTANHALVLLLESGIIMSGILAACKVYGVHGTIAVRNFPYRSTILVSVGIVIRICRRNNVFVCTRQICAVQSEVAVLGTVSSHTILCRQIIAAEIFQTELIACGIIHIVDSHPGGQIRQCVFAVCICACAGCIRRVVRLPLAAVIIILYCLDGNICNCRLVLCGIRRIICFVLHAVIVVVDPDPSGDVPYCQLFKAGIITGNIFLSENISAVHCIIRAVCIRSCTNKIGVFRQITALRIQIAVPCGIIALPVPGNGVIVRHFACHFQLIIAEVGFAVCITERIHIVKPVLAVGIRILLEYAGRLIVAVGIAVVLLQRNFYAGNVSLAGILQAVVIRIVPDTSNDLCLFDLLQAAVPVCLGCGICNVIVTAVVVLSVCRIGFCLCLSSQNQILIRCCQIEVLALIRIFKSLEFAVAACLGNAVGDLTVSVLRQCVQLQPIASQIPLAADLHKCGNIFEMIVPVAVGIYSCGVILLCCRQPCGAVPVILLQRHRQAFHASFFRRHAAVIIGIIPDSSADRRCLERPNAAMVLVLAVTAFCDVVDRIRIRNCTVSAVVIRVVLRCVSGMFSGKRLCLCCNDQIFLLAHESEFAVLPVQLVVVGKYSNCIAVRQCI